MKTSLRLLLLSAALGLFAGCSSTSTPTKIDPAQGAALLRVATSTGATLAIANNPRYLPAVVALAAGIDAIGNEDAVLTPDVISKFVLTVCARHDLKPAEAAVFVSLAQAAYTGYVAAYRPQLVKATDPNVRLYLTAFREGLRDAIAVIQLQKQR